MRWREPRSLPPWSRFAPPNPQRPAPPNPLRSAPPANTKGVASVHSAVWLFRIWASTCAFLDKTFSGVVQMYTLGCFQCAFCRITFVHMALYLRFCSSDIFGGRQNVHLDRATRSDVTARPRLDRTDDPQTTNPAAMKHLRGNHASARLPAHVVTQQAQQRRGPPRHGATPRSNRHP